MGDFIDLTGVRFGHLTAKQYTHIPISSGRRMPAWLCACDCGREKVIQGHHLRGGKTHSCGCSLGRPEKPGGNRKDWPSYGVWNQMRMRCENPNVRGFKHYGGRGIRVCERWRYGVDGNSGFECFVEDMGIPTSGMTLDRIDVNGDYEPNNCRWATPHEQRLNTRRSLHAQIGPHKIPLIYYAARTGIPYESIRLRVRQKGMTVPEAARDYVRMG